MKTTQDKAQVPAGERVDPPGSGLGRKSRKPNLRIYTPTGVYFLHAKINGSLIRGSMGTDIESVVDLRRDQAPQKGAQG